MFFSLEHKINKRFPNSWKLGKLILNTDNGWKKQHVGSSVFIFKGYADDCPMQNLIKNLPALYTGNFCVIKYDTQSGIINFFSDKWRQFSIFGNEGEFLSNFYKQNTPFYADATVSIDQNLQFQVNVIDLINEISDQKLSYEQVLDNTYVTILNKVKKFLKHNKLPIKVFISGGIDSTLVYSFIDKCTNDYEHVFAHEIQWDYFWVHNQKYLRDNFWGYTQIHHYLEPCVLTSGAPGDEFWFRSPKTTDIWLSWHGIDTMSVFADNVRYVQKSYFKKSLQKLERDTEYQLLKEKLVSSEKKTMLAYLYNNVLNDSQHWHLGNTLTFTPLRDFETFKNLSLLDPEEVIPQINCAQFSIDCIEKNNPEIVEYLSNVKNVSECYTNIWKLMSKN